MPFLTGNGSEPRAEEGGVCRGPPRQGAMPHFTGLTLA